LNSRANKAAPQTGCAADSNEKTVVGIGETPAMLSARTGVPVCMLLRANRLVSPAWLLPGREISIPRGEFCEKDAFPCPKKLLDAEAAEEKTEVCIVECRDTVSSVACAFGTTERLVLLSRRRYDPLQEGERILIGSALCNRRVGTVLPGETLAEACRRLGANDLQAAVRLNRLEDGRVWPGMRLILPDGDRV